MTAKQRQWWLGAGGEAIAAEALEPLLPRQICLPSLAPLKTPDYDHFEGQFSIQTRYSISFVPLTILSASHIPLNPA